MPFNESLAFGKIGESDIARWLRSRGTSVLPVYEKEIDEGKGPQFFAPNGEYVAPDMFCLPQCEWIEAKHKKVFTWHRISGTWQTGIDLRHWEEYKRVQEISKRRVWLFFLHRSNKPDERDLKGGSPSLCPTGLFGGSLDYLSRHIHHEDARWGRTGMVYWAVDTLQKLALLSEIAELEAAE